MKIALVGTAPSSMRRAPYGDPSWKIWGCSPGLYFVAGRIDAWFELHRWEPPVLGKPDQQKPWFSPEYCGWMAQRTCPVWMSDHVPEIPNSVALPWEDLVKKYGHFFFTSSLAWMAGMAIEAILLNRELLAAQDPRAEPMRVVQRRVDGEIKEVPEGDYIGFWGVDMAAGEEYGYQRAGCQYFATLAACLGIDVYTPPESDLMIPPALYGISESRHRHVKMTARKEELVARRNAVQQQMGQLQGEFHHLNGALDDMTYHMGMWLHEGDFKGPDYADIFNHAERVQQILAPRAMAEPALHSTPAMDAAGALESARNAATPISTGGYPEFTLPTSGAEPAAPSS